MENKTHPHSVLEIQPLPLTRLNSTTQPIYVFILKKFITFYRSKYQAQVKKIFLLM